MGVYVGQAGKAYRFVSQARDNVGNIDPAWFAGVETVLLTAGASAPEDLVDACLKLLDNEFGIDIEERSTLEEHVFFPLPIELRDTEGASPAPSLAHR